MKYLVILMIIMNIQYVYASNDAMPPNMINLEDSIIELIEGDGINEFYPVGGSWLNNALQFINEYILRLNELFNLLNNNINNIKNNVVIRMKEFSGIVRRMIGSLIHDWLIIFYMVWFINIILRVSFMYALIIVNLVLLPLTIIKKIIGGWV